MELVFGYLAGLLTLINPCVLPVLPIVLATALQASRFGPLAVAAGMSLSFVTLGLLVTVLGYTIGLTEDMVAQAGAILMVGFGLILMTPVLSERFATATAGFSAQADNSLDDVNRSGLSGQFLGGMLLGAVWSPCIGPTLGGAISLASQGKSIPWAAAIMVTFALGVSTIIIVLGYGARSAIMRRQALMRRIAQKSRPIMGAIFVAVGTAILFRFHHTLEAWAVQILPAWLNDFSVSL
ncbi:cytochrome c biogenesis CcdA family protein [Aliiroseovarius sp. PrR006]|uniref:cytochrome c biogenesis CcdA family protein n=1 Tax=Aliiroseovarius sp. PrR006 TaxID=2706883 RepID=UPI0013D522B9|nr:cytochrome c biogenesis CcdA family protein [Aliiroseovarius sp. PrR006]NDW54231.1 cytochrome c biogenesis protein CcdA [Aliiroseovarius sp. PrR006]